MLPLESHVDVLIIGAGPAGVMACNALARNGVNVCIVDQKLVSCSVFNYTENSLSLRPTKVAAGQADAIQPRTIEVLQVRSYPLFYCQFRLSSVQSYGLAQRLLEEGNQMHMAVIASPNHLPILSENYFFIGFL